MLYIFCKSPEKKCEYQNITKLRLPDNLKITKKESILKELSSFYENYET